MTGRELYILGPQRPNINLHRPFRKLLSSQPVAVISAGWQEAEGDVEHVHNAVQRPLQDLSLYQRAEDVFTRDPGLFEHYRHRQDRLQELTRVHRVRLRHAIRAARQLLRLEGDQQILRHEQRHAISQLRSLDRHHTKSIAAIHREFNAKLSDRPSDVLSEHAREIDSLLAESEIVVITGGNVAVLLNRLRLFSLVDKLRNKIIVAWSAGAMTLTDHVVLFQDRTPLEHREAEILDRGLGLLPAIVVLPDASRRLRQQDRVHIGLMSRRFAPARCFTFDSGAMLHYREGRVDAATGVRQLMRGGTLRKLKVR